MIRRNKQRGTAMVEFALILPVFVLLAIGGMIMLMASYTYGNVGYIAQQVAQCRANYLLGGAGATGSQCSDPQTYATTLGTTMNTGAFNLNPGTPLRVTETQGTPCPGCIQENITYLYTPFASLIPAFTMSQTAAAAVTIYSGTTGSVGGQTNSCVSTTVSIPNVTTSMVATASPVTPPAQDPNIVSNAYVSGNGTVTVNVCSFNGVPAPTTQYNVRVIP